MNELPNDISLFIIKKCNLGACHSLRFVNKNLHTNVHSMCFGERLLFDLNHILLNSSQISNGLNLFQWGCELMMISEQDIEFDKIAKKLSATGNLDIVKWLFDNNIQIPESALYKLSKHASLHGQLELLKWMVEKNHPWNQQKCFEKAVISTHLPIIQFIKSKGYFPCLLENKNLRLKLTLNPFLIDEHGGYFWEDPNDKGASKPFLLPQITIENAIHFYFLKSGRLDGLKWLENEGYPFSSYMSWEKMVYKAVQYGHLDIVQWLQELDCNKIKSMNIHNIASIEKQEHILDWATTEKSC